MKNEILISQPDQYANFWSNVGKIVSLSVLFGPVLWNYARYGHVLFFPQSFIKQGDFSVDNIISYSSTITFSHWFGISFLTVTVGGLSLLIWKVSQLVYNYKFCLIEGDEIYIQTKRFDISIKKEPVGKLSNYNHVYLGKGFHTTNPGTTNAVMMEVFVVKLRGENHIDQLASFGEFNKAKSFADQLCETVRLPLQNEMKKAS